MTKLRKKWVKLIAFLLVVAVGAGTFGVLAARADIGDVDNDLVTIHIDPQNDVTDGYIAVGVHLIHIKGVSSQLWNLALQSQTQSGQHDIYYRSELDKGHWYKVTSGESIEDIRSGSMKKVDDSEIAELGFIYKTDENGITWDLIENKEVNLFEIIDPYDLETLEELKSLRNQYQLIVGKSGDNLTDSDEIYLDLMEEFFAKDITNDDTDTWDDSLKGLNWYRRTCLVSQNNEWANATQDVMEQVDATRRYIAFENLTDELEKLQKKASGSAVEEEEEEEESDEEGEEEEDEEIPDLIVNADVISAIGDCIEAVNESMNTYGAKMLDEKVDEFKSKKKLEFVVKLISSADSRSVAGCDQAIKNIVNFDNISAGLIVDNDSEFTTISTFIIQEAYQEFAGYISEGLGGKDESEAGVISGNTKDSRANYEFFLDAMFKRMENQSAQDKTKELLNNIPAMMNSIKNDAVKTDMENEVTEHKIWLQKELQDLMAAAGDSDMDKLKKQLDDMLNKQQQCLDDGDMAGANRYAALAAALKDTIDGKNNDLLNVLKDPNSSQADKSAARAGLNGDSAAGIAADALDRLQTGQGDDADKAAVAAAAALDPNAVGALLDEAGMSGDDVGVDADALKGDGSGSGNTNSNLSEDALMDMLNSLLSDMFGEGGFDNASGANQAAAILALEWFGDKYSNKNAMKLSAKLANQVKATNPYIYTKAKETKEYITLQTLSDIAGYRYIFLDGEASICKTGTDPYYRFVAGSNEYVADSVKKKLGSKTILESGRIYISEDESIKIFSTKIEYLDEATLGVGYTGDVEKTSNEILQKLEGGGA